MTRNIQRPTLVALELGDAPQRWAALGFALTEDRAIDLGGVRLVLGGAHAGISRWSIAGIPPTDDIDGLATTIAAPEAGSVTHPNGATGLDHVVITTPDFDRTAAALDRAGMPLRRIRDAGGFRQGFRRLGPAILELVEATNAPPGPARFWGLVVIVQDLGWLASQLGAGAGEGAGLLGEIRDAVQPGRRIATLKREAGLGQPVALMTPEP
jgi:hypothetical protein